MRKNRFPLFISVLCLSYFLSSCRGDKSSATQVLLIRNMVDQTSYGPQSRNDFYSDKRAERQPVPGTVVEGEPHSNVALYKGTEPSPAEPGKYVKKIPIVLNAKVLQRGQERFDIYCSPCHGYAGNNDGLATKRAGGSIRPANLHDKQYLNIPVGRIYQAVTDGVNNWNMPGFSEQMSVRDRWAVVAYVRALQLSQNASTQDASH